MANLALIGTFVTLFNDGYIPSVGSWVQVDPGNNLTTIVNFFNTLGPQEVEAYLIDTAGNPVGDPITFTMAQGEAKRVNLADHVAQPFEGAIWVWGKGSTEEGSIGLQAIDLDFLDTSRPVGGQVLGSVHLIYDFINTLGIAPYLDLVSPRVLVDREPEGGPKYQNFLGIAHVLVEGIEQPTLRLTMQNENGEVLEAKETIWLDSLGSWFGNLEQPSLFPDLAAFLAGDGNRGYGVVGIREVNDLTTGLCAMIKVVDNLSGSMLVDHLNDRNFARPAMKDD
jgi:hypothetical protein